MKILLVCESSHINESGGRVVRYITKILKKENTYVKVLVLSDKRDDYEIGDFYRENDVEFLPIRNNLIRRLERLFYRTREVKLFRQILDKFVPDVVHFASFDHTKPPAFIDEAKNSGAKVILQPWTMHFFCSQGFGFRNGKQCTLCASGNFTNALIHRCVSLKGIPSLIEKNISRKKALNADVFLSSNTELDKILIKYGTTNSHISRFPIAFDYTFTDKKSAQEENYFIFYGQANEHKGLSVLYNVFLKLSVQKLKIFPMAKLTNEFSNQQNIEVVNGVTWNSGLGEAILNSKAVLVPSLWSTSTEYALCEALLMKKAVIVFNVGVHKDIFKNEYNALVIEPGNLNAFADAVSYLDSNETMRKTIGENGYNTLLDINNPDKLYASLINIYSSRK